jgi:hypothetical protein
VVVVVVVQVLHQQEFSSWRPMMISIILQLLLMISRQKWLTMEDGSNLRMLPW